MVTPSSMLTPAPMVTPSSVLTPSPILTPTPSPIFQGRPLVTPMAPIPAVEPLTPAVETVPYLARPNLPTLDSLPPVFTSERSEGATRPIGYPPQLDGPEEATGRSRPSVIFSESTTNPQARAADAFDAPPTQLDGDASGVVVNDGESTTVRPVDPNLLKASIAATLNTLVPGEEADFQAVFEEFLETKRRCGESTEGVTLDKFVGKLRQNREQLIERYACKTVKFQVYVKDGKAALKATPIAK
jgi:hypothetical protein